MSILKDIGIGILLLLISVILVAVVASYAAAGASRITSNTDWRNNPNLASAHTKLSWAASVGWIYVSLIIILIILLIVFAATGVIDFGLSDVLEVQSLPAILNFVNISTVIVLLIIGILSAIGTAEINGDTQGAKSKALTATLLSLGTIGLVIIYYIVNYFIKEMQKRKRIEQIRET